MIINMEDKIRYGLIGGGYWGRNLAQSLISAQLDYVGYYDIKESISVHPLNKRFQSLGELLDNCDAVLIATPAETHYDIALLCIEAGKHVFCEKPLTLTTKDAAVLCQKANEKKLFLGVDNTFLFTSEIQFIKSMLDINKFGKIRAIKMQRTNQSPILSCGCFNDLSSHDISILTYLLNKYPKYVSAFSLNNKQGVKIDGHVIYNYGADYKSKENLFVSSYVSWVYPIKVRKLEIITSNGLLSTEFDNTVVFTPAKNLKYPETFVMPNIKSPLINELISFNESIINNTRFVNNGVFGYDIVRILDKINESALHEGREVKI